MRIACLTAVFALVACAKADQKPVDTPASATTPPPPTAPTVNVADLKGTWAAKAMPMNRDTVLTTLELTTNGTEQGWVTTLPNGAKAKMTVLSVSGDSVITQSDTFASATRKGQRVSVHSIMHFKGDSVTGLIHAKYLNGDTATLRILGARKAAK